MYTSSISFLPHQATPHVQQEPPPVIDNIPEDKPQLKDLPSAIPGWHTLGIKLGIPKPKLDEIQADHVRCQRCTCEMFDEWLRNDKKPTYRSLMKVLREAGGFDDVVEMIQAKFTDTAI